MNKSDLISEAQAIAGDDVSKATVERVLNALLATIRNSISKHQSVQLIGFGAFEVVKRAKRHGVNPKTREKITIAEKYAVKFKPGTELRRSL
ncbi:MAG: HU family DNA-binding protein [Puniceicoccales bacterium]|jgi:DNA-binding protein HU-beta|nr:HU family DNA-binding protein [Puniceicoccales bacterium]